LPDSSCFTHQKNNFQKTDSNWDNANGCHHFANPAGLCILEKLRVTGAPAGLFIHQNTKNMTIRFAARLLLLTIVAATALTGAVAAETNSRPFLHPERIRYDSHCLTIDGKDVFIYSGAFHFFRCPT